MIRSRNLVIRPLTTRFGPALLMSAALAACDERTADPTAQLAQCACEPGVYACSVTDGARCVIDDASGYYDISGASDVTVRDGAAEYTVREQSALALNEGKAWISSGEGATVTVDGGTVLRADVLSGGSLILAGGTVADASAASGAAIQMGDGSLYRLYLFDSASATFYGGAVLVVELSGTATIDIGGGTIEDGVRARDQATIHIGGGTIRGLTNDGQSDSTIEGGSVETLFIRGRSTATLKGGTITSIGATDGPWEQASTVTAVGTGFNFAYGPVDKATLTEDGQNRRGNLTGTLANGDPVEAEFWLGAEANLYLCAPDGDGNCPCSFGAFTQGSCAPEP